MKNDGPKTSLCDVKVCTWGTHPGGGNGLVHYMDTQFFGGNVGHASIQVTFPADKKGAEWIKKYCLVPPIPYEKHKVQIKEAQRDPQGKYQASKVNAFEEEVYVVTFTWFPGTTGYFLGTSINADGLAEREGVNVAWDPKWREKLEIKLEQRVHKGKLGEQAMTYGQLGIIHTRDLPSGMQTALFKISQAEAKISSDLETLAILLDKMKNRVKALAELDKKDTGLLSPKEKTALEKQRKKLLALSDNEILQLDTYFPQWQEKYDIHDSMVNLQTLPALVIEINDNMDSLFLEKKKISEKRQNLEKSIEKTSESAQKFQQAEHMVEEREDVISTLLMSCAHEMGVTKNEAAEMLLDPSSRRYLRPGNEDAELQLGRTVHMYRGELEILEKMGKNPNEMELTINDIKEVLTELKAQQKDVKENKDYKDYVLSEKLTQLEELRGMLLVLLNSDVSQDQFVISNKLITKLSVALESDWKSHLKGYTTISREEIKNLLSITDEKMHTLGNELVDVQSGREAFKQSDFENYLTVGRPPDDVIRLPLNQASQGSQGHRHGMDVEGMLSEMQAIAIEAEKGEGFHLKKKNCSVTVGRILQAGGMNSHLKAQFANKAIGAIATPQMVLNNAQKYNEQLHNSPEDNILKRFLRLSPLKTAMGWSVGKIIDEKTSKPMKGAAIAVLVPILPAVAIVEGIKRLANPLKSFTQLYEFSQYVNSKKSMKFKAGMACLYGPAMAFFAVPAGVQYAGKKAVESIAKLGSKIVPSIFKKNKETHEELNEDQKKKRLSAAHAVRDKMGVTEKMSVSKEGMNLLSGEQCLINNNMVEISATNPNRALELFQTALDKYPDKMVFLSKETTSVVENYIRTLTTENERAEKEKLYRELCDASIQRSKVIQTKVTVEPTEPSTRTHATSHKRNSLLFSNQDQERKDKDKDKDKVKDNPMLRLKTNDQEVKETTESAVEKTRSRTNPG